MHYETIEIHFSPSPPPNLPRVTLKASSGEVAHGVFGIPHEEVDGILAEYFPGSVFQDDREPTLEEVLLGDPRVIGGKLFQAVFSQALRDLLIRLLGGIERQGFGLRLQLWLNLEDPVLARLGRLPWELLYDEKTDRFLLRGDRRWLLTRVLERAEGCPPLIVSGPLSILVAVACPRNLPSLGTRQEQSWIVEALRGLPVHVRVLESTTLDLLRKEVLETSPHIVHWIGHGELDACGEEGRIFFEGAGDSPVPVSGKALAEHLCDHTVRLVVLNACETAQIPADPFAGVATALLREGMPAVVAMQRGIRDRSAIEVSRTFYGRLAAGDPVDVAMAEVRLALWTLRRQGLRPFDWAIPVVYLRPPDGRVFELADRPKEENRFFRNGRRGLGTAAEDHLPEWVDRLLAWRFGALPAGEIAFHLLGAFGAFFGGAFAALCVRVLAGWSRADPLALFLLCAALSVPLSAIAWLSARKLPALRIPWLMLAGLAALYVASLPASGR